MQRIRSRKRDRALCDKGCTHDHIGYRRAAFCLGEFLREEPACKRDAYRRNHTADHDGCHGDVACLRLRIGGCKPVGRRQKTDARCIRRLVDGTAHIDGHHASQDQPQQPKHIRIRQLGKSAGQRIIYNTDQRVEDEAHQDADDKHTQQRIDQRGFYTIQCLWQMRKYLHQEEHDVPRQETGQDTAQETGDRIHALARKGEFRYDIILVRKLRIGCKNRISVSRQKTARKTDHKTGTVSDGICDITGQYRDHQIHDQPADIHQQCRERCHGTEVASSGLTIACQRIDQERDGLQQTAADDEGKHVGYTAHQLGIYLMGTALALGCRRGGTALAAALRREDRRFPIYRKVDQLIRLVDTVRHLPLDHGFAVEPFHGNLGICRNDDCIRGLDILSRQLILRSRGSPGLDLDLNSRLLRCLLQTLCRHIGMSDTRGAGGNGYDLDTVSRQGRICKAVIHTLLLFIRLVDDLQEVIHGGSIHQLLLKFLIHQHHGQLGKHIQMHIVLGIRCRDQEQQIYGLIIQRFIIHAFLDHHRRKSCLGNTVALSVRDRNTSAHAGGAFLLAGIYQLPIRFLILQPSTFCHQLDRHIHGLLLVLWLRRQVNAFSIEQVRNPHTLPSFSFRKHVVACING